MLTSWSKVKMYSQGVFDVWFACPYCGYQSWARAYGVGEGMDTGIQKSASAQHAQFQANVMAEHAASRAVHGSPCPKCGQHHPDAVRWAGQAQRQEKQRLLTVKIARALKVIGIGALVLLAGSFVVGAALVDRVLLVVVSAACLVVSRVLLTGAPPLRGQWVLYKSTAPGVKFLDDASDPSASAPPP